jgi:hypothetical protein
VHENCRYVLCSRAALTVPPLPLRDVDLDNEGGARSMSDTMSSAIPTVNMDDMGGGGGYTLCTQLVAYVCRECVCVCALEQGAMEFVSSQSKPLA